MGAKYSFSDNEVFKNSNKTASPDTLIPCYQPRYSPLWSHCGYITIVGQSRVMGIRMEVTVHMCITKKCNFMIDVSEENG